MFLLHENVFPQRLRRLNTTSWALGPVPWITEPFGEIGIAPASRLSLSAATVGTGRTFTSAAPEVPAAPPIGVESPLRAAASVHSPPPAAAARSEERRGGQEGVRPCRSRWLTIH